MVFWNPVTDKNGLKVYFRIPFFKYFIAKSPVYNKLCLAIKVFDNGSYKWKEI